MRDVAPATRRLRHRLRLATRFAWDSINQNRARMALAVLGVAIGIAAVASLLTMGYSLEARLRSLLDALGADVMTISVTESSSSNPEPSRSLAANSNAGRRRAIVDTSAVLSLLSSMSEVEAAVSMARVSQCGSDNNGMDFDVFHADLETPRILSLKLRNGRFLSAADRSEAHVIVGSRALDAVRRKSPQAQVGSRFPICGQMMTIVGVLLPHAGSELLQDIRIDDAILIGDGALRRIVSARPQPSFLARLRRDVSSSSVGDAIASRLRASLDLPSVTATGAWQALQSRRDQVALYARFLAILGGVSLLVGSLGIANVMMASVAERRTEVGLRLALGATRGDIVLQFLVESAMVCAFGACLGLALGIAGAAVSLNLAGIGVTISGLVITESALAALTCGLLAGAYPAWRASLVDPVVSLQGLG